MKMVLRELSLHARYCPGQGPHLHLQGPAYRRSSEHAPSTYQVPFLGGSGVSNSVKQGSSPGLPRDTQQSQETFLVVTTRKRKKSLEAFRARAPWMVLITALQRTAQTRSRMIRPKTSTEPWLRNSGLKKLPVSGQASPTLCKYTTHRGICAY